MRLQQSFKVIIERVWARLRRFEPGQLTKLPSIAAGFVLMAGSWWLAQQLGPADEQAVKLQPGKVDYYTRGLKRTVMDIDGNPKEYLVTDEMVHYDQEDKAELEAPIMTLYAKDGPPWVIHSETATIPGDSDFIFLNGNVLVLRDANNEGRTMRIETTNVRAQPNQDYAETDEDIRVISPPDYMSGTGATINFGNELKYKILGNVRRKHEVETENSE